MKKHNYNCSGVRRKLKLTIICELECKTSNKYNALQGEEKPQNSGALCHRPLFSDLRVEKSLFVCIVLVLDFITLHLFVLPPHFQICLEGRVTCLSHLFSISKSGIGMLVCAMLALHCTNISIISFEPLYPSRSAPEGSLIC